MMGLHWVPTSGNNIPYNAVQGGFESDGKILYIAKAINSEDGEWTPGKAGYHLLSGCHFPYGGKEFISYEYEVLTKDPNSSVSLEWRNCTGNSSINTNGALCISASAGLYIARGKHDGSLIPGKFGSLNGSTYLSYGGDEFICDEYEVLYQVEQEKSSLGLHWVPTSGNSIPSNAVQGGFEKDGTVLYIAKAKNSEDGEWTPGKAGYHLTGCHFPYGGKELISYEYEVLTKDTSSSVSLEWRNYTGEISDGALCTSTSAGLYVARGTHDGSLIPGKFGSLNGSTYLSYGGDEFISDEYEVLYQVEQEKSSLGLHWVPTSGNSIPSNAVQGGFEKDGTVLYIAKAKNSEDGEWTPGKAGYHLTGCHFPYGAKELISYEYEVLTKDTSSSVSLEWRNCTGEISDGAFCTSTSAGLYVARGTHDGSLIPGKFGSLNGYTYLSYGGDEFTCDGYEVLYQLEQEKEVEAYKDFSLTKYQPMFHDMCTSLKKGLVQLSRYVDDLHSALMEKNDGVSVISDILFPTMEQVKPEFTEMLKMTDNVVNIVNTDVEECVAELKNKRDTIINLEKRLANLTEELKGRREDVKNARNQVERKKSDLQKANEAFDAAQRKLDAAQEARKTAKIVGGLLFLLGPIGWIAGSATLVADATALKDGVSLARETRNAAMAELDSSVSALSNAENKRAATEYEVTEISRKKSFKEELLMKLHQAVEKLKIYQKHVVDLNVKVKNVDRETTVLYGKVKVLYSETSGGYSLAILKQPTLTVLAELSKFTQSPAVRSVCSSKELEQIKKISEKLDKIEWPSGDMVDI